MGGRRLDPGAARRRARGGDRRDPVALGRRTAGAGDASTAPYYRLGGAARGPAPAHDIEIWIGAYKPRMLSLIGRKADGWLPSLSYLQPGDLAAGNAAIDAAARRGRPRPVRDPQAPERPAARSRRRELTRFALEDGIGTFILTTDDPRTIETWSAEVVPAVREQVAAARARRSRRAARPTAQRPEPVGGATELGLRPTPDDGHAPQPHGGVGRVDPSAPARVRRRGDLQPARDGSSGST